MKARRWACEALASVLMLAAFGVWAQAATPSAVRAPTPGPRVPPMDCASQPDSARAFCTAYNAAIVACADKRAAADIRACMHERLPPTPLPQCPEVRGNFSASDRAACEQQQTRVSACSGQVGDAAMACLRARTPERTPAAAPVPPAPVGQVLPVAERAGGANAAALPLPLPVFAPAPAQPAVGAPAVAPPMIEAVPALPR